MDADEFRDYILGFIFYKYLSEKMQFAADKILQDSQIDITYDKIQEDTTEGKEYLEENRIDTIETLGFFLKPSELFSQIARRKSKNGVNKKANGSYL